MRIILFATFLLFINILVFCQDQYSGNYIVDKVSTAPVIDGILETSVWKTHQFKNFEAKYCTPFLEKPTSAAVAVHEQNLYIAIKAVESSIFATPNGKKRANDDQGIFEDDTIEICIYNPEANIYYHIALNFFESFYDSVVKIQRGENDISWCSGLTFAMSNSKGLSNQKNFEIKIPLKNLGLSGKEPCFRFNIVRTQKKSSAINSAKNYNNDKKDKKQKNENEKEKKIIEIKECSFFPAGENVHVYSAFGYGLLDNGLRQEPDPIAQILLGRSSQFAEMDVYYKAINGFEGCIPEGCEVGHGATLRHHDHIPVSQWSIKADGYLRAYYQTQIPEYLSLAEQILEKIAKMQNNTIDKDAKKWLPYWNLVDLDGKANGYDSGPDNMRGRIAIPYDQSKAKFSIASNGFADSFGFGLYQISMTSKDLPPSLKYTFKIVLSNLIDFYHRDYILFNKENKFFWRTSDFSPSKNEPFDEKVTSWLLGTDVVYIMLAYIQLNTGDEQEKLCLESLKKFSVYYIDARKALGVKNRANSSWTDKPLWRIEFLDGRMIDVVKNAEKYKWQGFEALSEFINKKLKDLYSYDQKVAFAEGGWLEWSESTTPLLKVYEHINPEKFKELFKGFVHGAMSPRGALPHGVSVLGMNASSYPLFLSSAFSAWQNKVISDEELIYVNDKFYQYFGSDEYLRNESDWVQELLVVDKKLRHWRATPDRGYVGNVMPESLWQHSESQGYLMNWFIYGPKSKQPYYESPLDRIYRNDYIQFAAPFQVHAEPYPYGLAFTFNTLKLISKKVTDTEIEIVYEKPELPTQLKCFGCLDVTDIYYQFKQLEKPTNKVISKVFLKKDSLPFYIYGVPEIEKSFKQIDNMKIVFCLPSGKPGPITIKMEISDKNKYLKVAEYD